jgi:UDP-N-acetylglucosamine 2-epimerase
MPFPPYSKLTIGAAITVLVVRAQKEIEVTFIWSGQHYSSNLKDVFLNKQCYKLKVISLKLKA